MISNEGYINLYTGNGVTTTFPFTFKVLDRAHLKVVVGNVLDTVQTTLTLDTHYTVDGETEDTYAGIDQESGGSIVLGDLTDICGAAILPTGWKVAILRDTPTTQLLDLQNQGAFNPEALETNFDKLVILIQQLEEQLLRCPKVTLTSGQDGGDFMELMTAAQDGAEAAQTGAQSAEASALAAKASALAAQEDSEEAQAAALASQNSATLSANSASASATSANNSALAAQAALNATIATAEEIVVDAKTLGNPTTGAYDGPAGIAAAQLIEDAMQRIEVILKKLSVLSAKGDIATYSTTEARLPVGTSGQMLTPDPTASTGLKWQDMPAVAPVSTKGDLYTYSTSGDRLPVGSDGKVLSANSNTATGLEWIDRHPLSAKGDIFVRTASGVDRLPVGASGQMLVADSAEATGLRWTDHPASSSSTGGGALVVTGSRASPSAITAAGGIAFTGTDARQLWIVTGDGGPIDITATPQIAVGTTVGQELKLIGTSDDNYVTLEDGTGLSMNGPMDLANNSAIEFVWDGTNWIETNRRG